MRLELGAGYRPTTGFVHQDQRPGPDIEIVCDAAHICAEVGLGVADEVRATHLLEHFSWRQTGAVLKEWFDLLRPKGSLYLEVPNLGWQVAAMFTGLITPDQFVNYAYGDQDFEGNYHHTGFTEATLGRHLYEAGFTGVEIRDIGQVLCAWGQKGEE